MPASTALNMLLVNKLFFTEAAPALLETTFSFNSMFDMQIFLGAIGGMRR
jgi:hypothetical protein